MSSNARVKVPVSMRALVQRINRKLAGDDKVLRAARGGQPPFGDYYVINLRINGVVSQDVEPEKLGRELGVLKPWEAVTAAVGD